MATPTTNCLYTTVMNISGNDGVYFSFLPPHGRRMGRNEMLTVAGNLADRLAGKTSKRQFHALERALTGTPAPPPAAPGTWIHPPSLAIISTPAVIVSAGGELDVPATAPQGQMISGEDKALGLVDPCWGPQTVPPPWP